MTRTVHDTERLYGHYRRARQHQRDVQEAGGGMLTVYPSGRTELSYASAPYGEHAVAAFSAAKHHVAWMARRRAA